MSNHFPAPCPIPSIIDKKIHNHGPSLLNSPAVNAPSQNPIRIADGTPISRLRLRALLLNQFRCYTHRQFLFSNDRTLLIGRNGVGKTSVLEAICVLLRLQSPRTARPTPCIARGASDFHLSGELSETDSIGMLRSLRLAIAYGSGGRRLWLDELPENDSARYLAVGRVVWFSGEDRELIRGSGTMRRRYLDFVCSQIFPTYLRTLRNYERALRARNHLLRSGASVAEIRAFDEPLLTNAKPLQQWRAWVLPLLSQKAAHYVQELSSQTEELDIQYSPCGGFSDELLQNFQDALRDDVRLKSTTLGPHRDDFHIRICGEPAAEFASEGQRRTLSLGLRLAQAHVLLEQCAQTPILLLDDVFAELDEQRILQLLRSLPADCQVIAAAAREAVAQLASEFGCELQRLP